LPTEQYNQDVVSLGMHAGVTAMDALECVRNATAMLLLTTAQAVDLRGGPEKLGKGSRRVYDLVRGLAAFQDQDRAMEDEVAKVASAILASNFQ
jgi:phenylalanine ammonia-lyase